VYKKRIVAFFLAVIVAVGAVGYRPQKAYASAVLVGEAVDVLFGLLGSAGVVVGFEQTFEMRQEKTIEFFESMSSTQQEAFWDWYEAGEFVTSDTGHRVFEPAVGVDSSFYRNFWQSVTDFTSTFISYAPPIAGYSPYTLTSSVGSMSEMAVLGSCSDNPFVVKSLVDDGVVTSTVNVLLSNGFSLYYTSRGGVVTSYSIDYVGLDTVFTYRVRYQLLTYPTQQGGNIAVNLDDYVKEPSSFNYYGNFIQEGKNNGIAFGGASGRFYVGQPDLTALNFYNGIAATNELIDCDTWVNKWEDALESDKQVGIRVGQDLSGYNTLDDIYNPDTGIVTGIDGVVNPGIPVTPDLTGISGALQGILNWLKTWLKSLIDALTALLSALFIPTDTALQNAFDPIMVGMKSKMDLHTFENFKSQMQSLSSPPAPNITMDRNGVTYTVVDFTSFNDVRDRLWGWLRGYLFVFILLYNMNFVYRLIRGQSMFDGMGTTLVFGWSDTKSGGSGGRDRGGRDH